VLKTLQHFLSFLCFVAIGTAQPTSSGTAITQDSLKIKEVNTTGTANVIVKDTLRSVKAVINPLAPSKAAFYSALLPGLGQIYNRKNWYWKVPIVYAAIGGSAYMYSWNNTNYKRFRTAFKRRQAGFLDDEFYDINNDNITGAAPDLDSADLQRQQERFQEDRDLWLVLTIAMYALNIIDANVEAHLQQFNIDTDLSLDFKPYMGLDTITNNPAYGMAFTIKF